MSESEEENTKDVATKDVETGDGETSGGLAATLERKKAKRMCRYRPEWSQEFSWSIKVPGNVFAVKCCLCRKTVSIAHGRRSDLVQHANTEAHKQAVCASSAASISKFFVKAKPTTDTD